jgi:hypothetical protein
MTDYSGMTVNERLSASNKFEEFDKAVADKDSDKLKEILRLLEVDEESIAKIVEQQIGEG